MRAEVCRRDLEGHLGRSECRGHHAGRRGANGKGQMRWAWPGCSPARPTMRDGLGPGPAEAAIPDEGTLLTDEHEIAQTSQPPPSEARELAPVGASGG
jgi:hypothetical protein